jgi:peroxiredoxin
MAPDFSLFDSEKKKVTLSDLKGSNVLLLFFPLAFTSTCTKELCEVRDNISFYNRVNAIVLGISVDSLYSLARYRKDQDLNFALLSDFNKEVSALYGSLYDSFSYNMRGVSKRSAFLVDREGVIQYAEVLENAGQVPQFAEITRILEDLH